MNFSDKKMRVVIAGGGTAGWLSATALSQQLGGVVDITLVESTDIGTVGVGEATIPPMKTFHRLLRIDEQSFMKATHATFKLGIEFENWKKNGEKYFHSFGVTGRETLITEFVHFWLRGRELGIASDFGDYCLEYKAAMENRFSLECRKKINYAFHLDAGRYAEFLKDISLKNGVKHVEGKIAQVLQNNETGFITGLKLDSGDDVEGDLFLDCTGFRGLLIEQTLHTGYEDWSHMLPCDRAIAVQTESISDPYPYTRSVAHGAGWRWRIPLQHRIGNGLVFCSRYLTDEQAKSLLLSEVEGRTITEPKVIGFKTGKRRKNWNKNCIAIGLASGFLEPLESTSIHLIMTALTRLLQLFSAGDFHPSAIDEYNKQAASEIERIRDFIIMHYKVTERDDTAFWRYCKNMDVPEELAHRIALFKNTGKSYQVEGELFRQDSWVQVMLGQGLYPKSYHPIVTTMKPVELQRFLDDLKNEVTQLLEKLPSHQEFVREYCAI